MIVVDSSILIAILFQEAEAEDYLDMLSAGDTFCMSSANLLEIYIVASRYAGSDAAVEINKLIELAKIEIVTLTKDHVREANIGFLKYGKGRDHKAQLNFGDCAAYGLAKALDAPLLFKGADFSATDIKLV